MLYLIGLVLLATSHGLWAVVLGAGVLIGMAMASHGHGDGDGRGIERRSFSGAQPGARLRVGLRLARGDDRRAAGQSIASEWGWRMGVATFVLLALVMLPAAWFAGRTGHIAPGARTGAAELSGRQALMGALRHPPFVVMALAYTVCGMQLVFLTTHLPAYLDICGMDPMLSAKALGMIGGFNVLGSLFFGWAGGRVNKLLLLGGIYICRSLGFIWFFHYAHPGKHAGVLPGSWGFSG